MKRLVLAAIGAATMAAAASAAPVIVTAAHMVDPVKGATLDDPVIVIGEDGRIVSVTTRNGGRPALPGDAKRIDLGDVTILPGLIDMHVHMNSDARIGGYRRFEYTDSFYAAIGVANARTMLQAGFTTVRNLGSPDYYDVGLKQAIDAGYAPGPRIVPATMLIGAIGGHCDDTEDLPPSFSKMPAENIATGPEAMRALVRKLRKYGAEVIKVCATGGVLSKRDAPGAQQMSYDELKAVADEAHMLGLKVAAHAHGTAGINDAIRAGVDTIEHASLADATSFKLAKEHGTWFSMDVYNDDYILAEGAKNGLHEESLAKERAIGLKQRQTFRAAHAAGVKMVFGTDGVGVIPAGTSARQFATMVQWGMTPAEAIRAATSDAAIALDRAGDVGQLAPGHYGDIVAVAGDPLKDVRLLEHPVAVLKGGVPVPSTP